MLQPLIALLAVLALPALLRRGGRGSPGHGRELRKYRSEIAERTARVDGTLIEAGETVDALRRRAIEVDEAVTVLQSHEDQLDATAEALRDMQAPEELHGLHMEYEANLERALRGIVTAERGCAITRLPHRPPEDEEPYIYWKRGHQNILHAQLRMREVAEVLMSWEPGRRAEVTVTTRLRRE
jgi:hypothetical protein